MSIVDFQSFREIANPGGTPDLLGLPEWPIALVRANGFDTGFELIVGMTGLEFSCNGFAADASPGIDEYDWFFSQGAASGGPFVVSRSDFALPDTNSGTFQFELAPWALDEYPDPFDLSTIEVLFFQVSAYVRRRADGAIQRLDLLSFLRDYLTPKVDVE